MDSQDVGTTIGIALNCLVSALNLSDSNIVLTALNNNLANAYSNNGGTGTDIGMALYEAQQQIYGALT